MRSFAVLSGVFLGAILVVSGYAMAFWHDDIGYDAPLLASMLALVGLPVAYFLKAIRKLNRVVSRVLFAIMMAALLGLWIPIMGSGLLREDHAPALAIFSVIWTIAALPLLRAGIRHRP